VALGRIGTFLTAEELDEPYSINSNLQMSASDDRGEEGDASGSTSRNSIDVKRESSYLGSWDANGGALRPCAIDVDADFTWETVGKVAGGKYGDVPGARTGPKRKAGGTGDRKGSEMDKNAGGKANHARSGLFSTIRQKISGKSAQSTSGGGTTLPTSATSVSTGVSTPTSNEKEKANSKESNDKPFALNNLRVQIPKGAFVAIVGPIGSGKSSLLQGLVGEMRRTRGKVIYSFHIEDLSNDR
jgi:ABC-type multidrug transport system fused ATPase/permease subunit